MAYLSPSVFTYELNTPAYEASFKNDGNRYVFSCGNDGKCRAVRFKKETGEDFINLGPVHTRRKAVRVTNGKLEYADILVCNECFLPVNSSAARDLNHWLRTVDSDDLSFLDDFDD